MAAPIKEIKRNTNIQVLLYPKEKEALKQMHSASSHANISEMVRSILFRNEIKVVSVDIKLENRNALLMQQTRNIGNNFNQLIKLFHSKKLDYFTTNDVVTITKNLEDIKSIYEKIEAYFKENDR